MAIAGASAGLLLFRWTGGGELEVLLGHMGGPFWARKDARAWTIPKGEYAGDEDPHAAALREFTEEIGRPPPPGRELALGAVRQKAGKQVTAWAREADLDVTVIESNTFELEWPPRSGRRQVFPELDRARWCSVLQARELIVAGQVGLIDALFDALDATDATDGRSGA